MGLLTFFLKKELAIVLERDNITLADKDNHLSLSIKKLKFLCFKLEKINVPRVNGC